MNDLVTVLIGAAWVAIFAMLVWGIVTGWRRQMLSDLPLPMFRLLEREGVSLARVEAAVGVNALARAASRCATCAARTACDSGVLGGWLGRRPEGCPNASLLDRVSDRRGTP